MKIYDTLTIREIKLMKALGNVQMKLIEETEDCEGIIHFTKDGMVIVNPFMDESGSHEVDPVEHYGEAFLKSDFMKTV